MPGMPIRVGCEYRGISSTLLIFRSDTSTRRNVSRYSNVLALESFCPNCTEASRRVALNVRTSRESS